MKSVDYQIPLCAEDRPLTVFEAEGKLYQYARLLFGLTNGVSFFQRAVDELIEKYKQTGTYAYLDNITVCGKDHLCKLNLFFMAAKSESLPFNESKRVLFS